MTKECKGGPCGRPSCFPAEDPGLHWDVPTSPHGEQKSRRLQVQRSQISGLLILAAALALFTLLRARPHSVFPTGWWRFW